MLNLAAQSKPEETEVLGCVSFEFSNIRTADRQHFFFHLQDFFKKEVFLLLQTRISRGKPLLASTDSTDASY
jgi:hypothetical protein